MTRKVVTLVVLNAFTAVSCVVHSTRTYSPEALASRRNADSRPIVRALLKSGRTVEFGEQHPAHLRERAIVRSMTVKTGGSVTVTPDGDMWVVTTRRGETYRTPRRPPSTKTKELTIQSDPIPLSDVEMIWTREVNQGRTALAIVGGIVLTAAAAVGLVAALKESCPFLYAYDGEEYRLEGELYSGAVFKAIERSDMLKLHRIAPASGEYRLRIANEANETQNTNELKLVVVDHPKTVEVFALPDGRVRTTRRPLVPPLAAADFDGADFTAAVASTDGTMWSANPFDKDPEVPANWTAGLVLRFPRPPGANAAKLVVRIGNTYWADAVFARVFGLLGSRWQGWYQKAAADPAIREKTYRFLSEQGIGLKVQVGAADGWRDAGFFHPTGPYGIEDDVLELDLADVPGEILTVRLRGGTFFWMVDRVAVDYSADVPVNVRTLSPLAAVDGGGKDIREALLASDDAYFSMPERGQYALVRYAAPPVRAAMDRSVFVWSRGHYVIHPSETQVPADLQTLLAIRQNPDLFLKYSLEELRRARRAMAAAAPASAAGAAPEGRR